MVIIIVFTILFLFCQHVLLSLLHVNKTFMLKPNRTLRCSCVQGGDYNLDLPIGDFNLDLPIGDYNLDLRIRFFWVIFQLDLISFSSILGVIFSFIMGQASPPYEVSLFCPEVGGGWILATGNSCFIKQFFIYSIPQ